MAFRDFYNAIKQAAEYEYGVGAEDQRAAYQEARERKGKQKEGPKMKSMLGSYRTPQVIKAVLGKEDPDFAAARAEQNIPIRKGSREEKIGTILGAVGADLTQDAARRFWWLLNAPQAVGEIIAEQSVEFANPALYDIERVGIGKFKSDGTEITKPRRKFKPGYVQALSIPAGYAINQALGLMTPFGGAEGYKAAIPSAEDPTKTDNLLAEIGAKYFLGRTGDLLPYDEFVKVRPDVSKDEYQRYKAYKFDKRMDFDPRDGDLSVLPMGVLKFQDEGIHGPEINFLGRSIPVTTGVTPFIGAVAGTMAGVRTRRPIKGGFLGGTAGLAAGTALGSVIEGERRRRNAEENLLDTL